MEAFISQLTYDDARAVVSAFLALSALAWGVSLIAGLIINRL